MNTIVLRFTSLTDLTTFSHMLNEKVLLNTEQLTASGFIPTSYISIAQTLFDATVL